VAGVEAPAGRLKHFVQEWENITSDNTILSYVAGCNIEFDQVPVQVKAPKTLPFSKKEAPIIDSELKKLIKKGVIQESSKEQGEYISNIFIRPKKNGSHRLILNLKILNQDIDYHHFKMDTIHTCIDLMTKGCFMASLDLRDAYYSVPIHEAHQKFLKFHWEEKLYKFTCLPNGLACAPRIFTKLLKPVFATLREKGHVSSPYLDDSFLIAETYKDCVDNVRDTMALFQKLGFVVHDEKSLLVPAQKIEHLGFVFDSINMTVQVNKDKIAKLQNWAKSVLNKRKLTVRMVAKLIGMMVSCFPGVEYGQLYYRRLDMLKTEALRSNMGNFDGPMKLTNATRLDIQWWMNYVNMGKQISHGKSKFELKTDASGDGWGAVLVGTSSTGGPWDQSEREHHINVLEIRAIYLGLKALCRHLKNTHIQVFSDNTTAVAYVKHMGGSHSEQCNDEAREIWLWCIENNIWLTIAHIPGRLNIEADAESRIFSDQTEWKLCPRAFAKICEQFGTPDIDLFASRLNYQCENYVAWRPDPGAVAINAFTVDWEKYTNCFLFPPFSMVTKVLQKMVQDNAQGIIVAPWWPTQSWFPRLMSMLTGEPLLLPVTQTLLSLPHQPGKPHPLAGKLKLMACSLSSVRCGPEACHSRQRKLLCSPGERAHKNNTRFT